MGQDRQEFNTVPETRPSTGDIISVLDGPRINELIEHYEKEDYYEKVSISRTRVDINPKSINIISNQNHVDVDDHIDRPKPMNFQSPSKPGGHYTVEVIKEPDSTVDRDSRVKPTEDEPLPARKKTFLVEDKHVITAEEQPILINTRGKGKPNVRPADNVKPGESRYILPDASTHGYRGPTTCTWIRCGDQTDVQPDSEMQLDGRFNYACSACGGFYCPVCKSTIPPQFRPPPGIKEYLAHSRATHIAHGGTPAR